MTSPVEKRMNSLCPLEIREVTDSGGYQEGAYFPGKRAVVVMPDTGWRDLTEVGWNILCDSSPESIARSAEEAIKPCDHPGNLFGGGDAGRKIVSLL